MHWELHGGESSLVLPFPFSWRRPILERAAGSFSSPSTLPQKRLKVMFRGIRIARLISRFCLESEFIGNKCSSKPY